MSKDKATFRMKSFRIPESLLDLLEQAAQLRGMTVGECIRAILVEHFSTAIIDPVALNSSAGSLTVPKALLDKIREQATHNGMTPDEFVHTLFNSSIRLSHKMQLRLPTSKKGK